MYHRYPRPTETDHDRAAPPCDVPPCTGTRDEAELLAPFLMTGAAEDGEAEYAVRIARRALDGLGGLSGLLAADQDRFLVASGLDTDDWTRLQAGIEIARRAVRAGVEVTAAGRDEMGATARRRLERRLRHEDGQDVLVAVLLGGDGAVLDCLELCRGREECAAIRTRDVAARVLADGGVRAVMLARSCGTRAGEVPEEDELRASRLAWALEGVEVSVLDYLIVAGGVTTSLVGRRLLDRPRTSWTA